MYMCSPSSFSLTLGTIMCMLGNRLIKNYMYSWRGQKLFTGQVKDCLSVVFDPLENNSLILGQKKSATFHGSKL